MGILDRVFGKQRLAPADGGYPALLAQAREELALRTAGHDRLWGLADASWRLDQSERRLVFDALDGTTASADAQIVGTYDSEQGSWLWAWAHEGVAPPLRRHAERLRALGQQHGWPRLTEPQFDCTENEAWDFAALACKVCEAEGAYRGTDHAVLIFMTFTEVRVVAPPPPPAADVPPPQQAPAHTWVEYLDRSRAAGCYRGYTARPIPDSLDTAPAHLCRLVAEGRGAEVIEWLRTVDGDNAAVLLAFAERTAALAVRTHSDASLHESLLALGLSMQVGDDSREGLLVMPLPWHAAAAIRLDPAAVFERAAAALGGPAGEGLRQWTRRKPEDQSLECMGYVTAEDSEGFRYRRTW